MRWILLLVVCVVAAGCATLTPDQIEQITATVRDTSRQLAETGIQVAAPDALTPGAAGGLAAAIAGGVAYLTRLILLKFFQRRQPTS